MVTRDDITWLYRCILGREPESEQAIDSNIKMFSNFSEARTTFLESREFIFSRQKLSEGDVYYQNARPRPFVKPPSKFGLVTIVKNEVERLNYMLESALPLVDFVSLVDTGSSDGTAEQAYTLLQASGVKFEIQSVDFIDFSHARNTALARLPKHIEWALVLDADEHVVQEDYQRFVDLTDIANVDAWNLPRFNFLDPEKTQPAAPYPDYQSRLFRNRDDSPIHFVGVVHEVLVNVRNWGTAPANNPGRNSPAGGPHIHHMGQVNLTPERFQEKHNFYLRLLSRKA